MASDAMVNAFMFHQWLCSNQPDEVKRLRALDTEFESAMLYSIKFKLNEGNQLRTWAEPFQPMSQVHLALLMRNEYTDEEWYIRTKPFLYVQYKQSPAWVQRYTFTQYLVSGGYLKAEYSAYAKDGEGVAMASASLETREIYAMYKEGDPAFQAGIRGMVVAASDEVDCGQLMSAGLAHTIGRFVSLDKVDWRLLVYEIREDIMNMLNARYD